MTAVRAIVIGLLAVSCCNRLRRRRRWQRLVGDGVGGRCLLVDRDLDRLHLLRRRLAARRNLTEDKLRSAVEDVKSATSDFVDDVQALGPPDTDAGEQAQESLEALADDLEESTETIDKALEDASGPSETLEALTAVTGALSTMGSRLSSTFTELEQLDAGGELEDAFEEADSCDELTSGSSCPRPRR